MVTKERLWAAKKTLEDLLGTLLLGEHERVLIEQAVGTLEHCYNSERFPSIEEWKSKCYEVSPMLGDA